MDGLPELRTASFTFFRVAASIPGIVPCTVSMGSLKKLSAVVTVAGSLCGKDARKDACSQPMFCAK